MFSNRVVFATLAAACVVAAAGGGYLASRQNAVPAPAAAPTPAAPAPVAEATPAAVPDHPVQETEAAVSDTKPEKRADDQARSDPAATSKHARKTPARAAATRQPPPLASTWPSSAAGSQQPAAAPPSAPPPPPVEAPAAPKSDEHVAEPPSEPPQKQFEELVVARDSVIGLQTETRISSETAHVEDPVEARVTRDVKVGDRVAIPSGARALGSVTLVERGGKFKDRARLGIRFHTIVLADGTRLAINTETIFREGDSTHSAAKIGGGAIGGAIIGAILGGGSGAAIGATSGAGAGTVATAAGDRSTVVLQPGTPLTVRIQQPVTVTLEKE